MEREDFSTSQARASKYWGKPRTRGNVTKTFQRQTGQWHWLPKVKEEQCHVWNITGGAASVGTLRRVYWLCLGWSTLITTEEGENDGGA